MQGSAHRIFQMLTQVAYEGCDWWRITVDQFGVLPELRIDTGFLNYGRCGLAILAH